MKKLLMTSLTLTLLASVATAEDGRSLRSALTSSLVPALLGQPANITLPSPLSPVPDPAYSGTVQTSATMQPSGVYPGTIQPSAPVIGQPVSLFSDVRYRATRNIAPCAVPTIIRWSIPATSAASAA
jgi:hypothetical protein